MNWNGSLNKEWVWTYLDSRDTLRFKVYLLG